MKSTITHKECHPDLLLRRNKDKQDLILWGTHLLEAEKKGRLKESATILTLSQFFEVVYEFVTFWFALGIFNGIKHTMVSLS